MMNMSKYCLNTQFIKSMKAASALRQHPADSSNLTELKDDYADSVNPPETLSDPVAWLAKFKTYITVSPEDTLVVSTTLLAKGICSGTTNTTLRTELSSVLSWVTVYDSPNSETELRRSEDEDLSKAISLYVSSLPAAYLTGVTVATIDIYNLQGNTDGLSHISDNAIAAISQVPVCKTNLSDVIKKPVQRNRQCSKLYQSQYVNVFYSGSKDKKVIQLCKKLNYLFEGRNIYGPYAEKLFSKLSLGMSVGLYKTQASRDCDLFVAAYTEYLSDGHQIPSLEFDPRLHHTRYASLLWDYSVNKASNEYVSDNQDPPRAKRTFIPSEDTKMIDVES
ncbi:hypothetical protein BC332_19014 [Capsicum chinense]|nr:hypothetical protein BC332_19014 [Capsicum chinense]